MLEVRNLSVALDGKTVVSDISLRLEQGNIGCLLGPSGCGKTTLLRTIAGFVQPRSGEVRINGRCVTGPVAPVPAEQRGVGMVFQDFALFPHLTARDNIAFGLHEPAGRERQDRTDEVVRTLEVADFQLKHPTGCRGVNSNGSRSRGRWRPDPTYCCWTNLSPTWTWSYENRSPGNCA